MTVRGGAAPAAMVLVLASSGCWLQAGYSSGGERSTTWSRRSPPPTWTASKRAWTDDVRSAAAEAVVSDGTAFVRCGHPTYGGVVAVALHTGARRWAIEDNQILAGLATPAVVGGRLHVPTAGRDCGVASLSPSTGEVLDFRSLGTGGSGPWSYTRRRVQLERPSATAATRQIRSAGVASS